MEVVKA